jgi:ATP-dependent protease ClpP protease subunit
MRIGGLTLPHRPWEKLPFALAVGRPFGGVFSLAQSAAVEQIRSESRARLEWMESIVAQGRTQVAAMPPGARHKSPAPLPPRARSSRGESAAVVVGGVYGATGTLDLCGGFGVESDQITGAAVRAALGALKARGAKSVVLTMDSGGGDLREGEAAAEAIRDCGIPVVAFVPLRANSAATLCLLAACRVVMGKRACVMIHGPQGGDESRRHLWREKLIDAYTASSGFSRDFVGRALEHENWLNADSAQAWGLAQVVGDRHTAFMLAALAGGGA